MVMAHSNLSDKDILEGLKNMGVDLSAASRLSDLTPDAVLEAARRCAVAVDPASSASLPTPPSPPTTSSRYALADALARFCSDRGLAPRRPGGLRPRLGHQTFLGGDDDEREQLRDVFAFLLSELKRQDDDDDEDEFSFGSSASSPVDLCELNPELIRLLPKESVNAAFNLIQKKKAEKTASSEETDVNGPDGEKEETTAGQLVEGNSRPSEEDSDVAKPLGNEAKLLALEDELRLRRSEVESLLEAAEAQREVCRQLEARREAEDRIRRLLPDAAENEERLAGMAEKSRARMSAMKAEWARTRKELDEEHRALSEEGSGDAEVEELRRRLRRLANERASVERERLEVAKALERQKGDPAGETRSLHVQRVMDAMSRVAKQRRETEKVAEDIRRSQKDVNLLEGKLHRTYAEVDSKVYERARADGAMVPAYRSVVEIFEDSRAVVEAIGAAGKARRSTADLGDRVGAERSRRRKAKAEKLRRDLEELKTENQELELTVKGLALQDKNE